MRGIEMAIYGPYSNATGSANPSSNAGFWPVSTDEAIRMTTDEDMRTTRVLDVLSEGIARFNSSFNLSRIANSISMK